MSAIKRRLIPISVIVILAAFSAAVGVMFYRLHDLGYLEKGGSIPVYGQMSDFELTERSGRTVRTADLTGRVWVADIIFTRCGGPCPFMSARAKALLDTFKGLTVVSFTSDPVFDTPEVLRKYADRYRADADRWLFLTGPMAEINRVSKGLLFGALGRPDMHSTRFTLIDRKGRVRGYYDSNDPEALARLERDLRALL